MGDPGKKYIVNAWAVVRTSMWVVVIGGSCIAIHYYVLGCGGGEGGLGEWSGWSLWEGRVIIQEDFFFQWHRG